MIENVGLVLEGRGIELRALFEQGYKDAEKSIIKKKEKSVSRNEDEFLK